MIMGSFAFGLGCLLVWWIIYKLEPSDEKMAEMREKEKEKDKLETLKIDKALLDKYGPYPDPRTSTDEEIKEYISKVKNIDPIISCAYFSYCRGIGCSLDHKIIELL